MSDIYFKYIKIKGYKGFVDSGKIELNVPDGNILGSGLNILVGENGSGKTSFLEAINLLLMSSFTGQSKISSYVFNKNGTKEIEIIADINEPFKYAMPSPWKDKFLEISNIKTNIKYRDRKSPGKLLSTQFQINSILEPINRNPEWAKSEISDFYLMYDPERLDNDSGINIFYFGKDRAKQSKAGWGTSFIRVMEDLNWRYLKDINEQDHKNKWKDYYRNVVKDTIGKKVKDEFGTFIDDNILKDLSLELLNLKEPFNKAFFAKAAEYNLSQIPLEDLGSGVELLFTILFLKELANQSKGSIIYCIDEPELSLHPKWQKAFFNILLNESKDKQIFIATHSQHFISPKLLNHVFKFENRFDKISISKLSDEVSNDIKYQKLFHLENREIFFTLDIIIVEGISDKERLRKFLNNEDLNFFVMNGLDNIDRIKTICSSLNIRYRIIVDLDYLKKYDSLLPKLDEKEIGELHEIKEIENILSSIDNAIIRKKLISENEKIRNNLKTSLSAKIFIKIQTDKEYKETIIKKINELKKENIYVLSQGMIEDYLDESGNIKNEKQKNELIELLKDNHET
jgi:predicted ATP-dependent endonuclease of OLD family